MKKNKINFAGKAALLAMLLSGSLTANASDGTITFTGKVQAATCAIQAGDDNQIIDMGTVATSAFKSAGDVAAPTRFDIHLEDCPASVSQTGAVSIRFDGAADSSTTSDGKLLLNDAATPATNLAVGIWNTNDAPNVGSVLGLAAESRPVNIDYTVPAAGTAKLSFISRYVATSAAVGAGDVHAVSNFTVI